MGRRRRRRRRCPWERGVGGVMLPRPATSCLELRDSREMTLYLFLWVPAGSGKTRIGGNKGGAILRAHQKKILARFHIFFSCPQNKNLKSQTIHGRRNNLTTHYLLIINPNRKMLAASNLRSATRVMLSRSPAAAAAAAMAGANGAPQRRVLRRGYHENIIVHYENPRNVGSLD